MNTKKHLALLLSFSTLAVAACAVPPKLEDAQYWQRKSATSALYLRGPKAQQTLHKDIADCVTEIDELERLGPLREALPAGKDLAGREHVSARPAWGPAPSARRGR